VKVVVDFMADIPDVAGPYSSTYLNHFGGSINAVPPTATAFAHRDYVSNFVMDLHWHSTEDSATQAVLSWARAAYAAMAPYISTSVYVNYLDRDLCNASLASVPWYQSYYGDNYDRLLAVKSEYDPRKLFSWPQSIGSTCSFNTTATLS
jgi:Berberine and berberine like